MANYYDILGVGKSSSEKEIKQAYRDLARKHHPDVNPSDKQAEEKFKKINEAYEVLSNPESKKKYDMYGENWQHVGNVNQGTHFDSWWPFGQSGQAGKSQSRNADFGDFENLFSGNIGGQTKNRYAPKLKPIKVGISLKEAFLGTTRQISINVSGRTTKMEVTIPPGVDTNSRVKTGPEGKPVILNIKVTQDNKFKRKKYDLYTEVDVDFDDLILGCEIEVETITGRIALVLPVNSQNKQKFKIYGQGMPILFGDGERGDLIVVVNAVIPDSMPEKQKQHIVNYNQLKSEN